jgi:competence protein ComEA
MKLFNTIIIVLLLSVSFTQPLFAKKQINKSTVSKEIFEQKISINLNKANAKEIAKALKGVGLIKAQAIIEYRKAHGNFKAIEELASVKGIGVATIAKNHSRIKL